CETAPASAARRPPALRPPRAPAPAGPKAAQNLPGAADQQALRERLRPAPLTAADPAAVTLR
ncbi:ABC transporter substrate-binding protein, partial [Streptomyces sp. NPDC127110]